MLRTVGLLYESLGDLDRSLAGLSNSAVAEQRSGASSFAWTAAHVTQMFESWILHRFMGRPRHELLADPNFSAGGTGAVDDWPSIRTAIEDVHGIARPFLDALTTDDLARTVPYDGSILYLRPPGLNLEYALLRTAAHYFVHASEIATVRSQLGHPVEDYRDWGRLLLG